MATRLGVAIRFPETDVRTMGRTATGVRAIRLAEGDEVVGAGVLREGASVLTVTEEGKGRRTAESEYRTQRRGGKGIRNYDELPKEARDYVEFIEKQLGYRIDMVSNGPEREAIIVR